MHEMSVFNKFCMCAALAMGIFFAASVSCQISNGSAADSISAQVDEINRDSNVITRTQQAEQLSKMVKQLGPSAITDGDIDRLIGLLSDKDDSVRYWAAMSLGYVGPAAKKAIPALQADLKEHLCAPQSKTSASAARFALERIGAIPYPEHCM